MDTSAARPARLVVLSGPTAVGKTTVEQELVAHYPGIWVSVSVTTRAPRAGEVDGLHYQFVDDARFDEMVDQEELLEWALVHRAARYGTPRQPVEEALAEGKMALLQIDLQGARQVRETMPDALFVFLVPPSWEELVRRLTSRATESDAEQARRLETAREELAAEKEFDVTLVNTDVTTVCRELLSLLGHPPTSSED